MTIKGTEFRYAHIDMFLGNADCKSDVSFIKRLTGENPNNITKISFPILTNGIPTFPTIIETNTQLEYQILDRFQNTIHGRFKHWIAKNIKNELSLKKLNEMVNRTNTLQKYKSYYLTKKYNKEAVKIEKADKIKEEKKQNMLEREFGKQQQI